MRRAWVAWEGLVAVMSRRPASASKEVAVVWRARAGATAAAMSGPWSQMVPPEAGAV
ncbi:hypothetical protein Sdia_37410 [Streptomyces diastaticus subsp. diastaticus]|uniref:Uncharacterized protein n=1 Tax=Streptomyces diastaticus subsp. diastaticus TaxID=68040 RepID=A0ABQ1CRZ3_STRDI|nr:hypothetical protein Sdia_37410 [Streptomyces diastaticus subsp. diastaticus]